MDRIKVKVVYRCFTFVNRLRRDREGHKQKRENCIN